MKKHKLARFLLIFCFGWIGSVIINRSSLKPDGYKSSTLAFFCADLPYQLLIVLGMVACFTLYISPVARIITLIILFVLLLTGPVGLFLNLLACAVEYACFSFAYAIDYANAADGSAKLFFEGLKNSPTNLNIKIPFLDTMNSLQIPLEHIFTLIAIIAAVAMIYRVVVAISNFTFDPEKPTNMGYKEIV